MFRDAVKILRALLGAIALMLVIVGGFFVGAETEAEADGEASWSVRKGAKSVIVAATRAAAACPLAAAAKPVGGRLLMSAPSEVFFARPAKVRSGAAGHGARREPEREPTGRARPGVVRLLI